MLGFLILYLKGTRIVMFQLSGFYYSNPKALNPLCNPKALASSLSEIRTHLQEATASAKRKSNPL